MGNSLASLYLRLTLTVPQAIWLLVLLFLAVSLYFAQNFRLDASADSLVLENDKDLRYYRSVRARYGSDGFLVVTYTPRQELFSDPVLAELVTLRDELNALTQVQTVTSILDVPLIDSPRMSLAELRQQIKTLEMPNTDKKLAQQEFLTSPLYQELLLSRNGRTTALLVFFARDERYQTLLGQREALREKQLHASLSFTEESELERISREFKQHTTALQAQQQANIDAVRAILARYRSGAEIHLGGVPMITSDMIDFIRKDIQVFGIGVTLFLIALLSITFKRLRWIIVPMSICAASVLGMVGYLGLVDWRVTVVSSNFISLMLIITLSLTVHLVVRFQELHAATPNAGQKFLLRETVRTKLVPSFYTAITTMVAFGSLAVSDIRPVIDFGWMMVFGVGLALVMAFLLFPALLARLKPGTPLIRQHDATAAVTRFFAQTIHRFSNVTLLVYGCIVILSLVGISRLTVENRFIDYFKDSTEIYKGMLLIDRQLGGTTPLEVIMEPDHEFARMLREEAAAEEEDAYLNQYEQDAGISGDSYWFNIFQLEDVARVHSYLDQLPATGKVLSLNTTMQMLTQLNGDKPLDNISLAVMYKRLPEEIKGTLFDPYMSSDGNQVRFNARVIDSDPNLKRDALLKKIQDDLVHKFGFGEEQVHLSGMLVLYNNVLQSLFRSQIMTLSTVFLVIMLMFLILFRSIKLALIGVVPTITAAALILGIMGWLGIHLDIMTITIAAITIGIGVDSAIHYIHRFKQEIDKERDYWLAVKRCHSSVGRAIYYTSITIALGFSILVLSNFIPTIYFGILTAIAMITALIANLTLLPLLIVKVKPFHL